MGQDRHTVPITCCGDGHLHLVTEDALVAGWTARTGRYRAVCGHEVAQRRWSTLLPDRHAPGVLYGPLRVG